MANVDVKCKQGFIENRHHYCTLSLAMPPIVVAKNISVNDYHNLDFEFSDCCVHSYFE